MLEQYERGQQLVRGGWPGRCCDACQPHVRQVVDILVALSNPGTGTDICAKAAIRVEPLLVIGSDGRELCVSSITKLAQQVA